MLSNYGACPLTQVFSYAKDKTEAASHLLFYVLNQVLLLLYLHYVV